MGHSIDSDMALLKINSNWLRAHNIESIDIKDIYGMASLKDIVYANLQDIEHRPKRIQEYSGREGHDPREDAQYTLRLYWHSLKDGVNIRRGEQIREFLRNFPPIIPKQ